jgi:hypothetical protein
VLSALAGSSSGVDVRFDRLIDPRSVAGNGSQFTFAGGIVATGATASGREVHLATSAQTAGQSYTVTVAAGVTDTLGTTVDAAANSASFIGYRSPAVLRITEVAPAITGSRDLVELQVLQGGATLGMTLVQDSTTILATFPDAVVATGDLIVVHLTPDLGITDAPGPETTAKTQYPTASYPSNYDTAWDFHGGPPNVGITFSNRIVRVRDPTGTTQDGASFALPASTPSGFPASLQELQADGQWLPADCGGVPCTYLSSPSAIDVSVSWEGVSTDRSITVRRVVASDTGQASDWAVGPSTFAFGP